MEMKPILIISALGYLLGSIPFGYLIVLFMRGADVRQTGSGNIGATNVSRTSPLLGVLTLFLDMLKGVAAVQLTNSLFPGTGYLPAMAALFAVLGHMFPPWLKFRGGKGVATALGSFLIVMPKAVVIALAIFLIIFLFFRYVSLASIVAVACLPIFIWLFTRSIPDLICSGGAALLIVLRHYQNLQRLLAGSESRLEWNRR
jgi:glycerol-3-phosphate acyltransferase PlsY